jgi:hypothetical protein
MTEEWLILIFCAAIGLIAWQHVLIHRLQDTVGGIATGKLEVRVDGNNIYITRKD